MGGHLTPFERALVRELALTGLFSTQRIAQLVQCSKATVIRIVKDIRHSEHIRFPSRTQLILKMHREGALNSVISRRLGITPGGCHTGPQATRQGQKYQVLVLPRQAEGDRTMDDNSVNEDRAPMVIAIMAIAISGAIVGAIFAGSTIWLLTH
jgi:hypothetical protein